MAPTAQETTLNLEITTARGESLLLDPIHVHGKTPSLEWGDARWTKDDDASSLVITVRNTGEQELSTSDVDAEIAGLRHEFQTITQPVIAAGETVTLTFSLPGGFEPDKATRVTLDVHKVDHPIHHWPFRDQSVVIPWPVWTRFLLLALVLGTLTGIGLLRHPTVTELSSRPKTLLERRPGDLADARRLLRWTHRLDDVLRRSHVERKWLDGAVASAAEDDSESR